MAILFLQIESDFFSAVATHTGALSVLDLFVLAPGQQFAHRLEVADLDAIDVHAEAADDLQAAQLQVVVGAMSLCVVLVGESSLCFELRQDVLLRAAARRPNEDEAVGEVLEQLLNFADPGPLAPWLLFLLLRSWLR